MSDTPLTDEIKSPPLGYGYVRRYAVERIERTLRRELAEANAKAELLNDECNELDAKLEKAREALVRLRGSMNHGERCELINKALEETK